MTVWGETYRIFPLLSSQVVNMDQRSLKQGRHHTCGSLARPAMLVSEMSCFL